jgi:lysozyme family protein
MADYQKLKPFILKWEAGFVNDPDDRGGATNKGVILVTFQHFFGSDKTVDDLKKITDEWWDYVFKVGYWDRWQGDKINNQNIANILVDWVWGSGFYGIKLPQKLLNVVTDGIVGAKTLAALNGFADQRELFDNIKAIRADYINDICIKRPANEKFKKGWFNRLNSLKYE